MAEAASTPPKGIDLYSRFALAGAVCCAVTHGALTPVDVVKTRIQLEPTVYNKGMIAGFRTVIKNEGAGALLTGFGPTFAGYFLQGAFKFGGYEFFKRKIVDAIGQERAQDNRIAVYLTASACGEFFADIALCPLEATRIRLVSDPSFANGLVGGFSRILREEGVLRGFYSGFGPILFKQIPYTMAKFVMYEQASETIYGAITTPKEQLSASATTAVNLSSGLFSGFCAAIVSQPADTLLSKINKNRNAEGTVSSRLYTMAKQLGVRGLFVGLGPRIVMVGSLTAFQFAIYDSIKRALGAKNGTEIAKIKK
ncbi:mitochondrial carrier domain-containing protein [Cladochytrium replicatum]|nr:mitochondrial carrier domain-containing protein [Cladochytrium replicatum]